MKYALLAVALLSAPAFAAEDGSLWEVTSKMDMPDMPEMPKNMPAGMMGGMGGRTTKICRSDDPREAITKEKESSDCKIGEVKDTGTKVTMEATCKGGRSMKIEMNFNKARSEYKGTMKMSDPKHGEMTMLTQGKKIGPCDAKKAKAENDAKIADIKARAEGAQAQYEEMKGKTEKEQIKACAKALDTMDAQGFGLWGQCRDRKDKNCKTVMESYGGQYPKVAEQCAEKIEKFCENFQTQEGFAKLEGNEYKIENAAKMCDLSASKIRKKLCNAAEDADDAKGYEFIAGNCPKQAKPLIKQHCAGRSYTVKEGDPRRVEKKWFKFCTSVAASAMSGDDDSSSSSAHESAPTPEETKEEAKKRAKKAAKGAAVDALKGLFGH